MGTIKLPTHSTKFFSENYNEIFESGNLAEGKWNEKVSNWACEYTSAKHALAVNSCGSGLFVILNILKKYFGKKRIFIQSNTMFGVKTIAISSGLEMCGYVDCTINSLMPTYKKVDEFIGSLDNPSECVFLLTHIGGWINPDIERIASICSKNGIALVEDCAHSLGSLIDGKHSGLFGVAGVYSLYATKAIPVGEGGILVSNNRELSKLAKKFIMYDRFDQNLEIGINFRMSELNALLTFAVIQETQSIINNKYEIAKQYIHTCEKFEWEYIKPETNRQRSNLYKFILLSRSNNPEKEFSKVTKRTSPVYDYYLGRDNEEITKRHICLPIWYLLDEKNLENSISELKR